MKKQVEIVIDSFNKKGQALAFDENNNKIITTNAIVKDKVLLELNKKRKGIIKAKLLKLLSPSPYRIEPKCEHAEICGGCTWQMFDYAEQVKYKEKMVLDAFVDFMKKGIEYFPIIASNPFEYRNKMEFSFSQNMKGTKYLGLMIKGGRRFVFNLSKCHLANKWFSKVLNNTRAWWEENNFEAYNANNNTGFLRNLIIREAVNTKQKMVILTVCQKDILTKNQIDSFINKVLDAAGRCNLSIYIVYQIAVKKRPTEFIEEKIYGNDKITEELNLNIKNKNLKLKFNISPRSFFQPNTKQAEIFYSRAINHLDISKDEVVYDLYSGTGTIGMAFSHFAKKVIAIELNEKAAIDAQENIKLNSIDNLTFYQGDVKKVLDKLISQDNFEKADLVVVDPPRSGLDALAIKNILKLNPKKILYISCNIETQKRDIKILKENQYKLNILHPIDQFPHTFHIENIAILKRT